MVCDSVGRILSFLIEKSLPFLLSVSQLSFLLPTEHSLKANFTAYIRF